MVLVLLGVTGLLQHGWLAAMTLLVLTGVIAGASLNRRLLLGTGCVALFAGAVWLMIGGAGVIVEVSRALVLHMSGLTTALPMVGGSFTMIICVLCIAVSWFVTQRSAGAYPALLLLVLIAVLLWLGNMPDVLPCLLPAAVACVTLLLRAGDEHISTLRVFPLAAVVTAIAFGGVAAGGAVSEPLKKIADDLRQRIYDTFFYTQPRDVFTLANEGYYPQGISQLGGPADPHQEPVMAVITPRKTYLRGVIKNIYTGRTWVENIGGRRYLWSAPRFAQLRTTIFDQHLPTLGGVEESMLLSAQRLQVRMLRDGASTMFVPQRIRSLLPEGNLISYFNGSSEIFATANLQVGDVWTVEAPLFTSADSGLAALVNAADTSSDANWAEVCDAYLQLPEHLQPEIYDIAYTASAGQTTPYGKALALQNYLAANYAYTLDTEEQNPEQDFVSTFLMIEKQGYCTYFASAMTVMCRMVGLPARYVEGFVAYPDAEGLAVVTGEEGHAWTEVYFRGFGWVTFDATPISAEYSEIPPENLPDGGDSDKPEASPEPTEEPPQTPPPEDAPTPTPAPEDNATEQPRPSEAPSGNPDATERNAPSPPSGFPWGWLLAVLLLLLTARVILVQPDVQARIQQKEFRRWLVYVQAVHDVLRRQGFVREKSETMGAFFMRAAASGRMSPALQELANAENLMFYGHAEPYAEETAQARACFREAYGTLNAMQKLLFHLQRVCLPAKIRDITAK